MKTITFFNCKSGVGMTSLVYHLGWMYAHQGYKVLAVDLDPQANLTSMLLGEEALEDLWPEGEHPKSVLGSLRPVLRDAGDIDFPFVHRIAAADPMFSGGISLVAGDLGLSAYEDQPCANWPLGSERKEGAFKMVSSLQRMIAHAAVDSEAEIVLVDVGPNLGAINRAALIASDHTIIPLAPDLLSMQGLRNTGPTLRRWRREWHERLGRYPAPELSLPVGGISPAGYVFMQPVARGCHSPGTFDRRIPREYRVSMLGEEDSAEVSIDSDPHCLANLKHYRSLMPMAMEARKPMFVLKPSDGAMGAHLYAVQECRRDFANLADRIAAVLGIPRCTAIPSSSVPC